MSALRLFFGLIFTAFLASAVGAAVAVQVATPVLAPTSAESHRYVTVTATSSTPSATIRYTLDGSDPTLDSALYSGSTGILLSGSAEVRVRAWKEGMEASAVVSGTYIVEAKIAAGESHVLALQLDGSVYSWGRDVEGQLGRSGSTSAPSLIPGISDIIDVAAGTTHSLALTSTGSVWTFGANDQGQLARVPISGEYVVGKAKVGSNVGPEFVVGKAVAAGDRFSMVLTSGNQVVCWGDGADGRLGRGSSSDVDYINLSTPVQKAADSTTLSNITAIAAGNKHALALDANQRVWAWGDNGNGRLGDNTTGQRNRAVQVQTGEFTFLSNVVEIAAGEEHSAAIDSAGKVWTWGRGASGQLGNGTTTATNKIAQRAKIDAATEFTGAVHIAAGNDFILVTREDGTLWASGANTNGSLGVGTTGPCLYLTQVRGADHEPLKDVVAAAGGKDFGAAVTIGSHVIAWGDGAEGETANRETPLIVGVPIHNFDLLGNPYVSLTTSGSGVTPANDVSLAAAVTTYPGQTISKVEFYMGDTLIDTDQTAPYTASLSTASITNLGVGNYTFRAVATDSRGATGEGTASHVVNPPDTQKISPYAWRGVGPDGHLKTAVMNLNTIGGRLLPAVGTLNASDFGGTLPWFGHITFPVLEHYTGMSGSTPSYGFQFQNPIIAFGKSAGASPLYKNKPYKIGIQCGVRYFHATIRVNVYNRVTGDFIEFHNIEFPQPTFSTWDQFVRDGYTMVVDTVPGLKLRLHWVSLTGFDANGIATGYDAYEITHEGSSNAYGYLILGAGKADNGQHLVRLPGSDLQPILQPLYTMEFDDQAPWVSELVDKPQFAGQPLPPAYAGKSAKELINFKVEFNWQPSVNPLAMEEAKLIDNSPEVQEHSALNAVVANLTKGLRGEEAKTLSLMNYVLNEIALSNPIGAGRANNVNDSSLYSPGIQRGAYATYMEEQGSAAEQCILLAYMLRKAGIPAIYCQAPKNKLLMLDSRLSALLGIQISGALAENGEVQSGPDPLNPSLIPTNFPWVGAYVNGRWVHLFPWLKDVEIRDGYRVFDFMPEGYKTAGQWVRKYLEGDPAIHNLIKGNDDGVGTLFMAFADKHIRQNNPFLSLEDCGTKTLLRKHYYTELSELPAPFSISLTPKWATSFASSELDTVRVQVSNGFDTGEIPLLLLHNRKFLLYFSPIDSVNSRFHLDLAPFDPVINGVRAFDAGDLNEWKKAQHKSQVMGFPFFPITTISVERASLRGFDQGWDVGTPAEWRPFLSLTDHKEIERTVQTGFGDMAAICLDYGQVSERMLDVHAREFWNSKNSTSDIKIIAGTPAYLMGMSYFNKADKFFKRASELSRVRILTKFGAGMARIGAERKENAQLPGGNVNLIQPIVDMFVNYASFTRDASIRLDEMSNGVMGTGHDAQVLGIADGSSQEHLTINRFFKKADAVSTMKLLRIAKDDPEHYPEGYLTLTAQNYASYQGQISALDPSMWTTINERFTSSEGGAVIAYVTSKKVFPPGSLLPDPNAPVPSGGGSGSSGGGSIFDVPAPYSGMGALILGISRFTAAISPGWNGGFGSTVPASTFTISNAPNLDLGVTANNDYFLTTIPSKTSYDFPEVIAQSAVSFDSIYTIVKQAVLGAYGTAPFQQSLIDLTAGFLGVANTYADTLKATFNKGYLGLAYTVGPKWNWISDPVNVTSGAFYHDEVDLSLPGPMPLEIRRNYNSKSIGISEFGYGWKLSLVPYLSMPEKSGPIEFDPETNPCWDIHAAEMDGSVVVYTQQAGSSPQTWIPLPSKNADLNVVRGGAIEAQSNLFNAKIERQSSTPSTYKLTSPDGSVRIFQVASYPIPGWLTSAGKINRKRAYLQSWTDNRGNSLTFTYGQDNSLPDYGQVTQISSSSGSVVGFNYDAFGHIVEAYTNDGRWLYYGYNQYGDLESVTRPDGSVFRYEYKLEEDEDLDSYTSTHLISRELRPEGRVLENDYDDEGRVTEQRASVGEGNELVRNAKFIYQSSGVTDVKDAFDRTTTYYFTGSTINHVVDPLSRHTYYNWFTSPSDPGYYPRGLKQIIDHRGLSTSFEYASNGTLTKKTVTGDVTGDGVSDTVVTTTAYDPATFALVEQLDPSGITTKYTYGNASYRYQPTKVQQLVGATQVSATDFAYGDFGSGSIFAKHLVTQTKVSGNAGDPNPAVSDFEYDDRGLLKKTTRQTGTTDPDVVTFTRFNLRGELVEQTDAAGRKTNFAYDGMGRPIWQEKRGESGELLWWDYKYYDGNGMVTWTDGARYYPEDYTWSRYDGGGRLIEQTAWNTKAKADGSGVEEAARSTTFHRYNAFGDLKLTIDPRGFATTMNYDNVGRLLNRSRRTGNSETSPIASTESFTYEAGDEIETHTDVLNGLTSYEYTADGRLKKRTDPDQRVYQWEYFQDGRLSREILPDTNCWWTTYDDVLRKVTRTLKNSAGTVLKTGESISDARGNVLSTKDALGNVFTTAFDLVDRPKIVAGPAATVNDPQRRVAYTYDAAGQWTVATNALGESTVSVMDGIGRPSKVDIYSAGGSLVNGTSYRYSADHHGTTVTRGAGNTAIRSTVFTDTLGREVLRKYEDGSFARNAYDAMGNLAFSWDEIGRLSSYTYDVLNHPDAETRPGGALIDYTYDVAGNLTGRNMPGGVNWSAGYDTAGRKTTEKLMQGATTQRKVDYTYYPSGNFKGLLNTETDARGITKTYAYDSRSRLETLSTSGGSGAPTEQSMAIAYEYSNREELTKVTQTGGLQDSNVVTRTFGPYGDIETETVSVNGSTQSALTQIRDAAGRRVNVGPSSSPTTAWSFGYRADGSMTSSGYNGTTATFEYFNDGGIRKRTFGGVVRDVTSRDQRGLPRVIQTTYGGGDPQLTETLVRDPDTKLDNYKAKREAGYSIPEEVRNYAYDARGRLANEGLWGVAVVSHEFDGNTENGIGLLTKSAMGTGPSVYQTKINGQQVIARTGYMYLEEIQDSWSYGHDAMGNRSSDTFSAYSDGYYNINFTWDALGRMVKGVNTSSQYTWTATYDGFGRRLKTTYTSQQPVLSVFDPEVEFLELEARQASAVGRKIYGPDSSGVYGGNQGVGGLIGTIDGATYVPIVEDYFGNVTARIVSSAWQWRYTGLPGYGTKDAYSMLPTRSVGQMSEGLSWQGRYGDPFGYVWMGARYYDSQSRTFVSADPMGHGASMSLYDYADGDPINNIDADGRIATKYGNWMMEGGIVGEAFRGLSSGYQGASVEKISTSYDNWYASNGGWEYSERERVRQVAEQVQWSQYSRGEQFARANLPGVENALTAIDAYAAGNTEKGVKYSAFYALDLGLTIVSLKSASPGRPGTRVSTAAKEITPNYDAVNWVREPATMIPEAADFYQAGAPASRFGLAPELSALDEAGVITAKFDGVDAGTGQMVDRKINVLNTTKFESATLRQSAVAIENGFGVRWEVPNAAVQQAAERLISKLGVKNIQVVVVPR